MMVSKEIHIKGTVQGVGFRPFVFSTAKKFNITGWVRNSSAGVEIRANGTPQEMNNFITEVRTNPPPLATIDEFLESDINSGGYKDFTILQSRTISGEFIPISPDVSICSECQEELFDLSNHRYRYPFINCTNCGPRLTIIKEIPYDRPNTTMAEFSMCDKCQAEYENPFDRRFHAQPIACPNCGPQVWFEGTTSVAKKGEEGIQQARQFLSDGKIIAIKGLGGFHLACDALNKETILKLRHRKIRSDKPFATTVFGIETVEKYCLINNSEKTLIKSHERPVVILQRKNGTLIPEQIAPGMKTIGIMLAYTPLHLLLLEPESGYPDIFVMTSGNISDEPIAYTNKSAKQALSCIADGFLFHNRDINTRVDDSVLTEYNGQKYFYRRSRGYAPNAITLPNRSLEILAVGGELKNTFCLTKEKYAFISHHIGDLKNIETYQAFTEGIANYQHMFNTKPQFIACDLHPEYLSTKYAYRYSEVNNIPLLKVQHHHAHLTACLADNKWDSDENVIGICLDGTGYGMDNQIWGGEILIGGYQMSQRKFHLEYMPLPGGDSAILHPNRIAAAYLWKLGLPWGDQTPAIKSLTSEEKNVIKRQLASRINTPNTSSMGRLFDAVASLIGLRHTTNYEAQAAIELEQIVEPSITDAYTFEISKDIINLNGIISDILTDINHSIHTAIIAAKFHNAIANLILALCKQIEKENDLHHVALSGGVWQNQYLLRKTYQILTEEGFSVLIHHNIPPNDGGISLGQAVIANKFYK
jgi:hydrogenase maturation protein HypF